MRRYKLYDIDRDRALELELTDAQESELKRFLKDLKSPAEMDYKSVLEQYNAICKKLPPATRLTEKRRRAIAKAKKEGYDLRELFIKTASSRFLCDENKQGWRASFDVDETMEHIKNKYRSCSALIPTCHEKEKP